MRIEIERTSVGDTAIQVVFTKNGKEANQSVDLKEFKSYVNQGNGRKWTMQVVVDGMKFERSGLMDWNEYFCIEDLFYSDIIAFLLKNIRRSNTKNAD